VRIEPFALVPESNTPNSTLRRLLLIVVLFLINDSF